MRGVHHIGHVLTRRFPLYLGIKVLLTITVLVYAASMTVTSTVHQADVGAYLSVTNKLVAMDRGFSRANSNLTAAGNCASSNVTFASNAQVANTNITQGDYLYDVQVNTTTNTPVLSCFAVTLTITPDGGSQQTSTVKLTAGTSVSPGWMIDCKFDVGPTLPSSPFSFSVVVQ